MLSLSVIVVVGVVFVALLIWCKAARVFLQRYEKLATILFAVLAGLYALLEYWDAQVESRMKETLSYIQRVQSGDVADARRWFDTFRLDNAELMHRFNALSQDPTKNAETEALLKELEAKAIAEPQGQDNIIRMFYFYADLAACTNLGICDRATSCEVFSEEIGNHYAFFADFVTEWASVSFAGKMREIVTFADSC